MSTSSTTKRSYTGGHFELMLDGPNRQPSTAYLKSVDGGHIKSSLIEEPIGPENIRIKHTSLVDIEPFSVEFGLSGANDVLQWIQGSWRKTWSRRDGHVTHADFDLYKQYEHQFYEALITETTFPTLDGASKEAAYIKIKVQPENIVAKKVKGDRLQPQIGGKQKLWMCSGFRLNIDGLDNAQYTNKIESFTIKQGVKKLYTGKERLPQIEPTKIEFPNLVGNISLEFADDFIKWHDQYVVRGQSDLAAQKSGSIEFLSPDRQSTIFKINLYEMGLTGVSMLPSTANAEQIKRMKFELYVGRMDIDGKGALGLE